MVQPDYWKTARCKERDGKQSRSKDWEERRGRRVFVNEST
jgi:hypothetical protein